MCTPPAIHHNSYVYTVRAVQRFAHCVAQCTRPVLEKGVCRDNVTPSLQHTCIQCNSYVYSQPDTVGTYCKPCPGGVHTVLSDLSDGKALVFGFEVEWTTLL